MATKIPLVLNNGQVEQLQSGDSIATGDPSYSPGSFTVSTETGRIVVAHLKLTTTQRATIEGTGRLYING
jgi:hypothetical protein